MLHSKTFHQLISFDLQREISSAISPPLKSKRRYVGRFAIGATPGHVSHRELYKASDEERKFRIQVTQVMWRNLHRDLETKHPLLAIQTVVSHEIAVDRSNFKKDIRCVRPPLTAGSKTNFQPVTFNTGTVQIQTVPPSVRFDSVELKTAPPVAKPISKNLIQRNVTDHRLFERECCTSNVKLISGIPEQKQWCLLNAFPGFFLSFSLSRSNEVCSRVYNG